MPLPSQKPAAHRSPAPQRPGTQPARAAALPDVRMRRSASRVMWHAATVPPDIVERLWSDPDQAIAAASMLKDGDRCTVARIDARSLPAGDANVVSETPEPGHEAASGLFTLKRYNLKTTLHTAIHMPLRSRARWSWINGRRLAKAGVPTPMPVACVEERRHGFLHLRSYLLTEFVPGRTLLELASSGEAKSDRLVDLAKQFAQLWRTLGQLRAGHGDMKATNFIVDPRGRLWLIDLDGMRIHRSSMLLRRERRNDLVRFMRNWQERPEVAAVFRARIGTG